LIKEKETGGDQEHKKPMKKKSYPQRIKSSSFLRIGCGKPDDIFIVWWMKIKNV